MSDPIYRTVFTVEVFSRGPFESPDDENLSDLAAIDYAINEGDCIGSVDQTSSELVPADEIEAHLLRIGNDGAFFTDDLADYEIELGE